METTYQVSGMTCGHCAKAVSTEIAKLPGVESVDVELAAGTVRVTSSAPLERTAVGEAVDEAGFELVGA